MEFLHALGASMEGLAKSCSFSLFYTTLWGIRVASHFTHLAKWLLEHQHFEMRYTEVYNRQNSVSILDVTPVTVGYSSFGWGQGIKLQLSQSINHNRHIRDISIVGLDVLENHLFSGICKHIVKFNDPDSVENLSLCCSSQIIRFMLKDLWFYLI